MSMTSADTNIPAEVAPLLVDVKRLAKMLCCSVRSVWRLRSSGCLPSPVKIGRSVRWDYQTIRTWIALGCPDRPTFEVRRRTERDGKQ